MSVEDSLNSVYSDYMAGEYVDLMEELFEDYGLTHLLRGRIVDLGCGSGRILQVFKEKYGCEAIGVDLQPTKLYKDIHYLQEDIRHTTIPAQTASFVFSINIGDYVLASVRSLTAQDICHEVDRLLIRGGVYLPGASEQEILGKPFEKAGYKSVGWGYQKS